MENKLNVVPKSRKMSTEGLGNLEEKSELLLQNQFMANVSHEIRTPLNGIIGMITLLSGTELNEEQLEYLEIIKQSSYSLMGIINDILDISKLNAAKLTLTLEEFDLRECIEASFAVVIGKAEDKCLQTSFFIDPAVPPSIIGDRQRIMQVIINLLSNAIKFTEYGKVILTVDNEIGTDPNLCNLKFTVTDTGIGISSDNLKILFAPFTQIDQSSTKMYQGTGLGLAICKQLCTLMNGKIWVTSELGSGSTFCFTLPLQIGDVHEKPDLSIFHGKKCLVVDDNSTNRLSLCNSLLSWNITPISCASAEEANIYLRNNFQFDFGLIDICMPKINGINFAMKLRKNNSKLPLIALSSLTDQIDSVHGPFQHHLVKPIKEKRLLSIIHKLLLGNLEMLNTSPNSSPNLSQSTKHEINDTDSEGSIVLSDSIDEKINQITTPKYDLQILVAEDIKINQIVITKMLNSLNYNNIDIAKHGKEVLDLIEKKHYDILFLDLKMPVMDGLECAKKLHQLYNKADLPRIVALTAVALRGDKEKYMQEGDMDGYLTKPIDINELLNELLLVRK